MQAIDVTALIQLLDEAQIGEVLGFGGLSFNFGGYHHGGSFTREKDQLHIEAVLFKIQLSLLSSS